MKTSLCFTVLATVFVAAGTEWSLANDRSPVSTHEGHRVTTVGTLKIHKSRNPDAAPYVLTDPRGEARYYLIEDEQLNLSPHVGERVRVSGGSYFDPVTGKMHIRVDRVNYKRKRRGPAQPVTRHQRPPRRLNVPEPTDEEDLRPMRKKNTEVDNVVLPEVEEVVYEEDLVPSLVEEEPGVVMEDPRDSDMIYEDPHETHVGYKGYDGGWSSCQAGCDGIDYGDCGQICSACRPRFWARAEYLLWYADGLRTPALVTTADEVQDLPLPTGEVLFGGTGLLEDSRGGGRLRIGTWFDRPQRYGLEGEFIALDQVGSTFFVESDGGGNPPLGRPFFNINPRDQFDDLDAPARQDAELVSEPDVLVGSVRVDLASEYESAAVRFRWNLCCDSFCCPDPCGGGYSGNWRMDWLLGYRFGRLQEELFIREQLSSLDTGNPGDFDIFDDFETANEFHGGEIGILWAVQRGCWSLEMLGRLALGANRQKVEINGETLINNSGTADGAYPGGLLTQLSNIGEYRQDEFTVIPELGFTLGYQVTSCVTATAGYSFIYWSQVVRPGDQIDFDVNPDFLPPPFEPFEGPLRPAFAFHHTDFWLQGVNFGLECMF